jgi:hypothetical protein
VSKLGIVSLMVFLVSGCSYFDQLMLSNNAASLAPGKVFVGTSGLMLRHEELDNYACMTGPLMCDQRGSRFNCTCSH